MIENLKMTRLQIRPIRPPFWATSGHMQTILGHLLPSNKMIGSPEKIQISLDHETDKIHSLYYPGQKKVVLYLFHGLGGHAEGSYMQRTAQLGNKLGFHVFMNNHRGCGEGVGLASEPYHSGRAEDLSAVIAYGKKRIPDAFHIAVGFSLSANALLLLAAKVRAQVLPDVAITVNAPINLERASLKLCEGLSWIYNIRFVFDLRNYVKLNRPGDLARIKGILNLRNLDEAFTAPIGGFRNRDDYYETCSAAQYLPQIEIPTIIISSEDDPFVSAEDYKNASLSKSTILHLEKSGGHMGYLTKSGKGYSRWLDSALSSYLSTIASSINSSSR